MGKLFLLRHLKSRWNEEDRFNGWIDTPISAEGFASAKEISQRVFKNKIDVFYSSDLFRNKLTMLEILDPIGKYPIFVYLDSGKMKKWGNFTDISDDDVEVFVTEKLNERYYGKIQGMNKRELMEKYGEDKVKAWRRSYDIPPPKGESLKDVYKRTTPFFRKYVEKDLKAGKNVLIVASHNSLRAIVKYVKKIPDDKIADLEIAYGGLLEFDF